MRLGAGCADQLEKKRKRRPRLESRGGESQSAAQKKTPIPISPLGLGADSGRAHLDVKTCHRRLF